MTPARLALHEDAVVGVTVRASGALGSYGPDGTYIAQRPGNHEVDFEEDILGAVRVWRRGQVAILVPLVETYRAVPGLHEAGGGAGDVNFSARYDFEFAHEHRYIPGIALLAGLTVPTGTPPNGASQTLATDATGIGAYQGNAALALEQIWGSWLVNATGLVAKRSSYSVPSHVGPGVHETLGTQWTLLGAVAYTLRSEAAVGLVASYAFEGDATINGVDDPNGRKRALVLSAVGLYPLTDAWRLQGSVFTNLPVTNLGRNQPATAGATLTLLLGFS